MISPKETLYGSLESSGGRLMGMFFQLALVFSFLISELAGQSQISAVSQRAYLKASYPRTNAYFGASTAVSGDTVVVGAFGEASRTQGINGNATDISAPNSGAAYVFVRSGMSFVQQAYLKASNTDRGDAFGVSVGISGDTIVVGASSEDSAANSVNGDGTDNSVANSGAAYVFVRVGTNWTQQAYLKPSDSRLIANFGVSVAIDGDTVVVGAFGHDSSATGINSGIDGYSPDSGAAYVFVRTNGTWKQQAYLKASNTGSEDLFGSSVGISGDTVIVGAPGEASGASGVNADQSSNAAANAGAAYVFIRSGTNWTQQAYMKASNAGAGDAFGWSVGLSGNTAVVGAHFEDGDGHGINNAADNNLAPDAGAAYVFIRSSGVWTQQAYLKASNTDPGDEFGSAVAASGNVILVGGRYEDSSVFGVGGSSADNSARESGAAYVFVHKDNVWSQQAYLKASNTDEVDAFGTSVALAGSLAVVGSRYESSGASGINGNGDDNSIVFAGAAYIFDELGREVPTDPGGEISTTSARMSVTSARGFPGKEAQLSVLISRVTNSVAAQFDLSFDPAHVEGSFPTLATDSGEHHIRSFEFSPGHWRTILYSRDARSFRSNGALANVVFRTPVSERFGSGPITPSNVIFADQDGKKISPVTTKSGRVFVTQVTPPDDSGESSIFYPVALGGKYILLASFDLKIWVPISANSTTGDYVDFIDRDAHLYPHRFYMLVSPSASEGPSMELSITLQDNHVLLPVRVTSGYSYVLESSTNLLGWLTVSTNLSQGSQIQFPFPLGPSDSRRFFRVRGLP